MKSTTVQLCKAIFLASGVEYPVYFNSVKNKIGTCELNSDNIIEVAFFDDINLSGAEKFAYLVSPNDHGLPQSDFYALIVIV